MPGNVKMWCQTNILEEDAEEMVDYILSKSIGASVPDEFFKEV